MKAEQTRTLENEKLIHFLPAKKKSREILHKRAQLLAEKVTERKDEANRIPFVKFRLGNELFGIPSHQIIEVIQDTKITRVPNTPNYIAGIINRRSFLNTVLSLKHYFKMQVTEYSNNAFIIFIKSAVVLGLLVDEVEGNDTYDPETLSPPLSVGGAVNPDFILGIYNGIRSILKADTIIELAQDKMKH